MHNRFCAAAFGLVLFLMNGCSGAIPEADESQVELQTAAPDPGRAEAERRFGLIVAGRFIDRPPGVTCFTPGGRPPLVLRTIRHGDAFDDALVKELEQARLHNLAIVDRPDYPDADLCRATLPADRILEMDETFSGPDRLSHAARSVARPVATLHEAARRGSPREVRRFLRQTPIDARDELGVTPLVWAIARNRPEIIDLLLDAGANPLALGQREDTAFYWAAALGRGKVFAELLERAPTPMFWRRQDLRAALMGGDTTIIRQMLSDSHEMVEPQDIRTSLSLPAAELLLRTNTPGLADALFQATVSGHQTVRLDLLRLAISHGADVNAVGQYETPLGQLANGIWPGTPQAVQMLLEAGGDPNALSHRSRPIWEAVGTMKLDGEKGDADARALQILDLLLTAGGDINLPDYQGRPPVWALFFPRTYDHDELDPSFVTKDLLTDLTARGLDLNAPSKGRRILSVIEEKAGPRSEYALWLRELGARP